MILTRILPALAFAAATLTTPALAQRPVLTQNIDEPARAPFQRTILFNPTSANCPNQFYCVLDFGVVPAGKRLVITYASATFSLVPNGSDPHVDVGVDKDLFGLQVGLPTPQNPGGGAYSTGGPVTAYIDAGHSASMFISGNTISTSSSASVTLVGHYIQVQIP